MRCHLALYLPLAVAALISGCAAQPKYAWGKYDASLYAYYKAPAKEADLAQALEAVIQTADAHHAVVAPGIYAEYGYLLLQQGNTLDATRYFTLESTHWPESKAFMARMVQVAAQQDKKPNVSSP